MRKRRLDRSGITVPPVIFGGNVFGWTADRATSFRLLDALVDAGLNAIDTTDVYSTWVEGHPGGESETIIGEWLSARPGRRDSVVILTKVGMPMRGRGEGLSAAWIGRAVEDSLRRSMSKPSTSARRTRTTGRPRSRTRLARLLA
jgi:aryl-alcohol dehydrogenase-like predicted oxidoreductase